MKKRGRVLVVLQVGVGELAAARSLADGAGSGLEAVRPQEGCHSVFGQAALATAAQAFATGCQQAARAGGQRADGLVEGLSWSMDAYDEVDQEAAQGAQAIGGWGLR